jgi:hypothetical protein
MLGAERDKKQNINPVAYLSCSFVDRLVFLMVAFVHILIKTNNCVYCTLQSLYQNDIETERSLNWNLRQSAPQAVFD